MKDTVDWMSKVTHCIFGFIFVTLDKATTGFSQQSSQAPPIVVGGGGKQAESKQSRQLCLDQFHGAVSDRW